MSTLEVYRFGPQNQAEAGLPVWALKPGGTSGGAGWRLRRARGIITKLASRQSEVVKVACLSGAPIKSWTVLPLEVIWVVCFM